MEQEGEVGKERRSRSNRQSVSGALDEWMVDRTRDGSVCQMFCWFVHCVTAREVDGVDNDGVNECLDEEVTRDIFVCNNINTSDNLGLI